MSNDFSRRTFLKGAAAASAGLITVPALGQGGRRSSDRIRFAIVGVGGRGEANLRSAAQHGDIVALCDIDAERRAKALVEFPDAATFEDFRRMLDAMRGQIDAVVVSTPDHTHAPAAAMAMHYGKHVYVEKPLTRTIGEARRLAEIAARNRVITQMGNQGTSHPALRKAVAVLQTGVYGYPREIHCWTNRAGGWWPQGVERPAPGTKPRTVDFDLWLGPSPERPYAAGYHPFAWRGWWDFGSGALGDIGCHCMNLPFMAFDLRDPLTIQAETSGHNKDSFPAWSIVTYEFGPRGSRPPTRMIWYDGGKKPSPELVNGEPLDDNGCIIVCEKATLYSRGEYGGTNKLVGGRELPDVPFEVSPGHFEEFAQGILTGKRPRGHIPTYSGALTETVLLGNLAVWASGERLQWDARRLRVPGRPEFDELIRPKYREGWSL
ncbi:MAG TPA: Gfo/Idh/MocA family oxidoreductase [Fimbriimonadaceae bacterium]|nr:Gfo/Idh/MocA family oxidoreductase [Fimbriimonadaceae bacterium]